MVTICTAQWSLYVPQSGHYMYHTVVTICTLYARTPVSLGGSQAYPICPDESSCKMNVGTLWSDTDGEARSARRKTRLNASLSTTNLTGIGLGSNPGLRGECRLLPSEDCTLRSFCPAPCNAVRGLDFHSSVAECSVLGYDATSVGNRMSTFWKGPIFFIRQGD